MDERRQAQSAALDEAATVVAALRKQGKITGPAKPAGLKVSFNPWAYTIEQNNAFLAAGYEVMPIAIPNGDAR